MKIIGGIMGLPIMQGSIVTLVPLEPALIEQYCAMFSEAIAHILHTDVVAERQYIQRYCAQEQKDTLFYCIMNNQDQLLIGAVAIRYDVTLYSWLNEVYWGKGYYQEALSLIAQCYFQTTTLNYFNAHVDVTNKRSYYALKKCGFASFGFRKGPFGKQYHLVLRRK